jgi:nitrogen fixation protein NifZ
VWPIAQLIASFMPDPLPADDPSDDDGIETAAPPRFEPGDKVRARSDVRDDGTFPGAKRGDLLIGLGEVGYVRSVGVFLQRYYIYDVDFYERARIVGMRGSEIELADGGGTE